jgi:ribosome hibernation promoting factor
MQIDLTGQHVEITPPLREYVNSKLDRLTRHSDQVLDIHVILSVEKLRHTAEATLRLNGGNVFADATEEDMYAAIDALTDKLDRQVKKHNQKLNDHHRNEGSHKNHV